MIFALRRLPALEIAILIAATLVLVVAGVLRERNGTPAESRDAYSTYDATGDGYRAFFEMLEREGVRVERFERRLAFLDASLDTLVWAEPPDTDPGRAQPTRADVAALEAWVRGGGRILYLGHDDAAARAGILHLPRSRSAFDPGGAGVARALQVAGVTRLHSTARRRWWPQPAAHPLVYDRAGPLVLAYALGRGVVVAVVDEQWFANANLVRGDRARLAYALARPLRPNGRVAFDETMHGYALPEHWWSIVPRPLAVALGVAGLALLLGFSGAAMRLGPALAPSSRTARSSADFIDAVAALLERGGAPATALGDAARSATRALARALGAPEETSPDDIAKRMTSAGSRAAFVEMLALAAKRVPSETDLTRGIALAQRLRKETTVHGRPRY